MSALMGWHGMVLGSAQTNVLEAVSGPGTRHVHNNTGRCALYMRLTFRNHF